jgi:hypothetical protein
MAARRRSNTLRPVTDADDTEYDDSPSVSDTATFTESWNVVSVAKLWILWARSAITRTDEAIAARAAITIAQRDGESPGVSRLHDVKCCAALVAVCSAVFAVESVSIALRSQVVDQATIDGWTPNPNGRKRASASKILGQITQRAIVTRRTADDLAARWRELYDLRGRSVHYTEGPAGLVDHPIGTRTDPVHVDISAEAAQEATSTLLMTLRALRDDPTRRARRWSDEHRDALAEFI